MTLHRRSFLHALAGAAGLTTLPRTALAQAWPTRPVKLVVGFAAGGSTDIAARIIGQWLQERLGQPFIIENKPGAATNIATESVARAQADGYTLLMMGPSSTVNATLFDKLDYVLLRDIAPVAGLARQPQVLLATPQLPAKSVPELIAYAKANPGKVTMASAGIGSAGQMMGELFKMMAGIDCIHVPYRGAAPLMNDLLGGQVMTSFSGMTGSIQYVKSGQLRALAVTTATRADALPDVPALGEFVPGYEAGDWLGIGAPKDTPADIIDRLNKEVTGGIAEARIKARFTDLGIAPMPMTPAEFGKLLADDIDKWAKVIRAARIKPE